MCGGTTVLFFHVPFFLVALRRPRARSAARPTAAMLSRAAAVAARKVRPPLGPARPALGTMD